MVRMAQLESAAWEGMLRTAGTPRRLLVRPTPVTLPTQWGVPAALAARAIQALPAALAVMAERRPRGRRRISSPARPAQTLLLLADAVGAAEAAPNFPTAALADPEGPQRRSRRAVREKATSQFRLRRPAKLGLEFNQVLRRLRNHGADDVNTRRVQRQNLRVGALRWAVHTPCGDSWLIAKSPTQEGRLR